jgi:uncharacterized protein DUF3990
MPWNNGPLTLYHGTDSDGANAVMQPANPFAHGVNLARCRALTDFGRGFYTTTSLRQARNWANLRYLRGQVRAIRPAHASVLEFRIDRNLLVSMDSLTFVTEGSLPGDFWDLVTRCRSTPANHALRGASNYDVVYGPVSLWPQTLTMHACDQVSFHTDRSLAILPLPVQQNGNPLF